MSGALGIDAETLAALPSHRESDRFTPLERDVLDLAVAMTSTPVEVPEELRRRLLAALTPGRYAELAASIALENHRTRLNRALDVRAPGFSAGSLCVLPERPSEAG